MYFKGFSYPDVDLFVYSCPLLDIQAVYTQKVSVLQEFGDKGTGLKCPVSALAYSRVFKWSSSTHC